MQGYSSCKQNHMKICYKCAQISFLGVKLWNVQYVEVKLRYRQNTKSRHPKPKSLFSHIVIISSASQTVKELLCLKGIHVRH